MAVSCFGAVEAAAEGPEIVKKYYVSTAFEPTAEAPDGSWDGWTVRDDAGYPASNAELCQGRGQHFQRQGQYLCGFSADCGKRLDDYQNAGRAHDRQGDL